MMRSMRWTGLLLILLATASALALMGCSGEMLLAYTGGGLPPGEPDLGGVVVASVDGDAATAQTVDDEPPAGAERIVGARVTLMRGQRVVGRTTTGEGGYFRFERPDTGSYAVIVEPPTGREDLRGAQRNVNHVRGQRTFVTIELPRVDGHPEPPGPGPVR